MTAPLDEAWNWYDAARESARALRLLGGKFWDDLSADHPVSRNSRLKELTGRQVAGWADTMLAELDDLGVLLPFSAFEGILRDRTAADVRAELAATYSRHPAVTQALEELLEAVQRGSAAKVIAAYKPLNHTLAEEVNQVRRYRNWVAHGRRGRAETRLTPEDAYDRLRRFLAAIDPSSGSTGRPAPADPTI